MLHSIQNKQIAESLSMVDSMYKYLHKHSTSKTFLFDMEDVRHIATLAEFSSMILGNTIQELIGRLSHGARTQTNVTIDVEDIKLFQELLIRSDELLAEKVSKDERPEWVLNKARANEARANEARAKDVLIKQKGMIPEPEPKGKRPELNIVTKDNSGPEEAPLFLVKSYETKVFVSKSKSGATGDQDAFTISFPVPGCKSKDMKVWIEGNVLNISTKHAEAMPHEEGIPNVIGNHLVRCNYFSETAATYANSVSIQIELSNKMNPESIDPAVNAGMATIYIDVKKDSMPISKEFTVR
jgi:hypothetical protein